MTRRPAHCAADWRVPLPSAPFVVHAMVTRYSASRRPTCRPRLTGNKVRALTG
jgi:hypothetical protein